MLEYQVEGSALCPVLYTLLLSCSTAHVRVPELRLGHIDSGFQPSCESIDHGVHHCALHALLNTFSSQ